MKKSINKEFGILHEAIENIFHVDLIKRCRNRDNVNARTIFSKILLDKGYTTTAIAEYLGLKNHSSIVHYSKRFDGYILNDRRLKGSYESAKAVYFGSFDPVFDMSSKELKDEVFNLRRTIKSLEDDVTDAKEYLREVKEKYVWKGGFDGIQELLHQKCPIGEEMNVQHALNTYLNGLHY